MLYLRNNLKFILFNLKFIKNMRIYGAKAGRNGLRGTLTTCLLTFSSCLISTPVMAQLSTNPDKFLGNITTNYSVDYGNEKFYTLWNQITPENESKWGSIEGSRRGSFNWDGCDKAYNYAKQHKFPFKLHCLIWGAQYPSWMDNLSSAEQYKAIEEWMDAAAKRYPDLQLIDVVNEAIAGHQPAPYKDALGGDGKTGYDWIIKAFEMAHERWPNAILIYNDFNTFRWQKTEFINLVRTLRDAGAPIDAYGCQSHDVTDMELSEFKSAMTEIQNALKIPMYSTEYDIGTSDDELQAKRYSEQIPYMWEADYCAGVTLWGYIYGHTWTTDGNSGIIRDGKDRKSMKWLRSYMQTDAAKNAKSPFPGMVKEASLYIKPSTTTATKDVPVSINVRARMRTKSIDHIDLYVKNQLYRTLTEYPYEVEYTPTTLGKHALKAVVVNTDGSKYERLGSFTSYNPRATFKGEIEIPGTLQIENFDTGGEAVSFHDSDTKNEGTSAYRTNGGGVDIVSCNGGYAVGYTATGEWLEYTVDVKKAGMYSYDAYVSAGNAGSSIQFALSGDDGQTPITDVLSVPCVQSNNWDNYRALHGRLLIPLEEGKQIIRLRITSGGCNVDKVVFKHVDMADDMRLQITANPTPATINSNTKIKVDAVSPSSDIKNVRVYMNGILLRTLTNAPYEFDYKPTTLGEQTFTAEATCADGKESELVKYILKVNNQRYAYKGAVSLPGVVEAENFDKGGEGFTFHDIDSKDEGKSKYRSDNEGVDIVSGNGGYAIGYTENKEWMDYTVNVKEPGKYSFEATVASGNNNTSMIIGLMVNGKLTSIGRMTFPNTGWGNFQTVKGKLMRNLDEGQQILRFYVEKGGFDLDKIEFICTLNTDIDDVESQTPVNDDNTYNIYGIKVNDNYKGIVIRNGKKILKR